MKINLKVTPIFQGNTITIPLVQPILLKGTREDRNFAFIFNNKGENYYIFVTIQQGVINNNLPDYLDHDIKSLLIESVNQYCESSRQGLPDNIFVSYLKKNSLCLRYADIKTNNLTGS